MEKLEITKIPAHASNYTVGRGGNKIRAITIHHMAAVWTAKRCGESFQQAERDGSSHYGIGYNGEIAQYVDEKNTAWTNGDWDSNLESVTIECANSAMGNPWIVSNETLNSLILLIADIAKRNGLVPLVKGKNLTWHQMFDATACPGPFLLSKMDYIVESANALLTNTKYIVTPVSVSYRVFTNRWLPDVYGENINDADNGYAGVIGIPVYGVQADASVGNLWYRAHVKNADWLPEVKNRDDYAGAKVSPMDGFMIQSDVTNLRYRVHTAEDGWLPPVTGYNPEDHDNGYAGVLGHVIDAIVIGADEIIEPEEIYEEPVEEPEPIPEKSETEVVEEPPVEATETPVFEELPSTDTTDTPKEEKPARFNIFDFIVRLLEAILNILKKGE